MTVLEFLQKAEPKKAAQMMCDTLELRWGDENCVKCPFHASCKVGHSGWEKFFERDLKSWEEERYARFQH